MYRTKTKITSFVPNSTKRRFIPSHCRASVHTVAYTAWLSSTATTCVTKRLQEDLDEQQLCVKYVYGKIHAITARRVCNDCTLPTADDAEATVSTCVRNYLRLYRRTTLRIEWDDELPG